METYYNKGTIMYTTPDIIYESEMQVYAGSPDSDFDEFLEDLL